MNSNGLTSEYAGADAVEGAEYRNKLCTGLKADTVRDVIQRQCGGLQKLAGVTHADLQKLCLGRAATDVHHEPVQVGTADAHKIRSFLNGNIPVVAPFQIPQRFFTICLCRAYCPNTSNTQSAKLFPASQHREAGIGSFPGIGFQHQHGAAVVRQSEQIAAQFRVLINAEAV